MQPSKELQEAINKSAEQFKQLQKITFNFYSQIDQIQKERYKDDLVKACEHLFNKWKKSQKDRKKVSGGEIQELISDAKTISGTKIKIVSGISKSEATVVAGAITKEDNFVAHIFDGNKLVSMASDNVNIDLREIAPKIGKILGGSGGGKQKLTQCGGPKKENINDALEKAKELTIKKLKKL